MAGLTRVAVTRPATLTHTWYAAGSETLTDPTGTPSVTVTAADGVSVQTGSATITGGGTGTTTFALSAVSTLEFLTVVWTATVGGVSVTETDYVEVVGGYYWDLAEGRASDSALSDTSTYPTSKLATARLQVEQEVEAITDRAFVPRYLYIVCDGTGMSDLTLPHPDHQVRRSVADIRTVRSASMAQTPDATHTALTASELGKLAVVGDNTLRRTDGRIWTHGDGNVIVEIEYGLNRPPTDLKTATMTRLRHYLNLGRSSVPDRALSWSPDGFGGAYRIDQPGPWKTGWPEVDAAYARYSRRQGAGGDKGVQVPAARTLTYAPQRWSLFHSGRGPR